MLYYTRFTRTEDGFSTTYINVWLCGAKIPTVASQIDGCIGNKAGYRPARGAETMILCYEAARDAGFTRATSSMLGSAAFATICYLHYQPSKDGEPLEKLYCSPTLKLGDELPEIERATKLVKRLIRMERKVASDSCPLADPERVITVLKRLRAVEITMLHLGGSCPSLYCTREKINKSVMEESWERR